MPGSRIQEVDLPDTLELTVYLEMSYLKTVSWASCHSPKQALVLGFLTLYVKMKRFLFLLILWEVLKWVQLLNTWQRSLSHRWIRWLFQNLNTGYSRGFRFGVWARHLMNLGVVSWWIWEGAELRAVWKRDPDGRISGISFTQDRGLDQALFSSWGPRSGSLRL